MESYIFILFVFPTVLLWSTSKGFETETKWIYNLYITGCRSLFIEKKHTKLAIKLNQSYL